MERIAGLVVSLKFFFDGGRKFSFFNRTYGFNEFYPSSPDSCQSRGREASLLKPNLASRLCARSINLAKPVNPNYNTSDQITTHSLVSPSRSPGTCIHACIARGLFIYLNVPSPPEEKVRMRRGYDRRLFDTGFTEHPMLCSIYMYNWSTDENALKKYPKQHAIWKLEQMVNFGLDGEKLYTKELKRYWPRLFLDPRKKRYLEFLLWGKLRPLSSQKSKKYFWS